MAKGPCKRMLCQRWEGRQSLCEGSGVSGDRFASRDSPIHLSLTLTQGPGVSSQLVVKHPTPPTTATAATTTGKSSASQFCLGRGDSKTGSRVVLWCICWGHQVTEGHL